jgi:hypothetical protein
VVISRSLACFSFVSASNNMGLKSRWSWVGAPRSFPGSVVLVLVVVDPTASEYVVDAASRALSRSVIHG